MQVRSFQASAAEFNGKLPSLDIGDAQLVILFGGRELLEQDSIRARLKQQMPAATVVGCSTSGEIHGDRSAENSLAAMAIRFDATPIRVVHAPIAGSSQASHHAGASLARQLMSDELKAIMVLSPGVNVNGSALVSGIREAAGSGIKVFGGLAGDGTSFKSTVTILDEQAFTDHVVAVGFYGANIRIGTGSRGGWQAFGPVRRVTKAAGNVLNELDGKPALALYKQYLGERAAELPASGLLYPFAILSEDHAETGLIRTILDVSEAEGSLTLAGDLAEGSLVRLMHADNDALVDGAEAAATEANDEAEGEQGAAICVSCVGRRLVMGNSVDDEVESVRDILGEHVPVIGYYSYGEICPFQESGLAELHNQTMTVTVLREVGGNDAAAA